jgi:hypothetical protein
MIAGMLAPFRRVWVYVADPGAVAMLDAALQAAEIAPELRFCDGWAAARRERDFVPAAGLAAALSAADAGTALLLGSQVNFPRTWDVLAACARHGVASVFFFDHWKNYARHFVPDDGRPPILPDLIAVPDDLCREGLIAALTAAGIPPALSTPRLRTLGHFAVSAAAGRITATAPDVLDAARRKYGAVGVRTVGVLPDPTERAPIDLGYDWRDALAAMADRARRDAGDARFLVKAHPRQDPQEVAAALAAWRMIGLNVAMGPDDAELLIALADEVWGMTSVALVTALTVGKPIVSFQPGRNAAGAADSNPHIEPFVITLGPG